MTISQAVQEGILNRSLESARKAGVRGLKGEGTFAPVREKATGGAHLYDVDDLAAWDAEHPVRERA